MRGRDAVYANQKLDHEMISSREEKAGPSIWTVIPKLLLRIGRSPFKPTTGLRKHHAGTTPISTLEEGSFCLNKDFG